uniref:Uncharacterized protein n=1 Tax=Macrostomum lignano TaxID=282301 RepID=A0A1I8FVS1_9PLAT
CGPAGVRRLEVVYARQTSRFQFPQGGAVCEDTVKSRRDGRQACREANVTDAVRRRCNPPGEAGAAASCELEPGPHSSGHSCAPHHLLVIFACVPLHYYANSPQTVSTVQQRSNKVSQNQNQGSVTAKDTFSPKNGGADVAQNDQGGGRQQLSAAAAAAAAAGDEAEAGQESQLRRGKEQGPNAGNE